MKTWTSGSPGVGAGPRGSIKSGDEERRDSLARTVVRRSASAAKRNLSLIARLRRRTTRGSSGPGRRAGVDLLWPSRRRPSGETERALLRRPGFRTGEAGVELKRMAASEEELSGEERSERSPRSSLSWWDRLSSPAAPEDSRTSTVGMMDLAFLLRRLRRVGS